MFTGQKNESAASSLGEAMESVTSLIKMSLSVTWSNHLAKGHPLEG